MGLPVSYLACGGTGVQVGCDAGGGGQINEWKFRSPLNSIRKFPLRKAKWITFGHCRRGLYRAIGIVKYRKKETPGEKTVLEVLFLISNP